MSIDDVRDKLASDGASEHHTRRIGIYVGILAVLLAICTMAGGNATKDAMRANVDATNMWAFFQAKNVRRVAMELSADELEALLLTQTNLQESARTRIEGKIKELREKAQAYKSDPKSGEGLDELFAKARQLEKDRDMALRRDPYFDYAQALLQISIVLASVALVAGGGLLLGISAAVGALGVLFMVNGMTLAVALPFIG
jgi:hypothetical protein